jgi:hypothetical protein
MSRTVAELCGAIRRYVERHPDAADTAEGIRQWWISDVGRRPTAAELAEALEQLVESHALQRNRLASGAAIYSAYGSAQ